jgi:hypothetical protein
VASEEHLQIIRQGVEIWNERRQKNPELIPDLSEADLEKANFRKANLCDSNLSKVNLIRANLNGANLNRAHLNRADLSGAEFCRTNLGEIIVDFTGNEIRLARRLVAALLRRARN